MRFPVFALIAPIVTSLVLWMVTKSPYTLLFALMGPVMAVASFLDARAGERRRQRLDGGAAEESRAEALVAAERARSVERARRRHEYPAPGELATLELRARPPWNPDLDAGGSLRLGLALGTGPARDLEPLIALAGAGIVCVGNPIYSLSLARALWMQLAWNVAPATLAAHSTGHERDILRSADAWPVRLVDSEAHIPPSTRYVIDIVSPNEGHLSDRDDPRQGFISFIPDYCTAVEATEFAQRLAHTSQQIEDAHPDAQLPNECTLQDVMQDGTQDVTPGGMHDAVLTDSRASLSAPIGLNSQGVLELDLVAHGPHAVVTGMTGTGKTEFLLSWILASARRYSPEIFTVLVIDFKGGSGFARIAALPHCVGIVTDLDVSAAQRALHSLRAELRFRERALNDAGVTDYRDVPPNIPLARLMIIVDEYRALLDRFSELQPLFLDIAARGRALGVHLVLGTQRATGVLADGILANCPLRIVFRVNNASDSMALLESDAARTLPEIPGRAVLRGSALSLTTVHVARSTSEDSAHVFEHVNRWLAAHPSWCPRRPWLPELPSLMSLAEVIARGDLSTPTVGVVLGLVDEPEEQRQKIAHYVPRRDGHLLVVGEQGSGKSSVLTLIASQTPQHVSLGAHNAEEAWDGIGAVPDNTLLLIDNLEALFAEFTLEHRDKFLESLLALLRSGPTRGIYVVITSQSGSALTTGWMALMKTTIALEGPPGRAHWGKKALQFAQLRPGAVPEPGPLTTPPFMTWTEGQQYVVVTSRPRLRAAQLTALDRSVELVELVESVAMAGTNRSGKLALLELVDVGRLSTEPLQVSSDGAAQVFIGDVEDWQSQFTLLTRIRPHATFVFDDCSPAEVRAVRRSRDVLPHVNRGSAISVDLEGVATRVRLI